MNKNMVPRQAKQTFNIQKVVAGVSLCLLLVKFTAYYFTGSIAILTDALESIANVVAGFIGLYSLYVASMPRDMNHPYGHGKAEFLSAAVEGTLIGIAGITILYKSVHELLYPQSLRQIDIGIILVAITALLNFVLGRYCIQKARANKSVALEASGRHLITDTYSTLAVVAGLIILYFSKLHWLDAAVAITMALFILYTAYHILRSSIAGIMDEADTKLLNEMIGLINKNRLNNWVDMHNLRVIKYGSILHVDCHLTVPWYLNVHEAHQEIDALAKLIKDNYGEAVELFVHSDGCLPFQCPICLKQDCTVRQHPFTHKITWNMENVVSNKKHNAPEENVRR